MDAGVERVGRAGLVGDEDDELLDAVAIDVAGLRADNVGVGDRGPVPRIHGIVGLDEWEACHRVVEDPDDERLRGLAADHGDLIARVVVALDRHELDAREAGLREERRRHQRRVELLRVVEDVDGGRSHMWMRVDDQLGLAVVVELRRDRSHVGRVREREFLAMTPKPAPWIGSS